MDMKKMIERPQAAAGPAAQRATPRKSLDVVDLKQYFHVVVKRIWLVALCFVLSLTFTVVSLVRQVPRYQSTATILLSRGLPLPARLRQEETVLLGDYLATQQRIISSSLLIQRAKERLDRPQEEIGQKLGGVSVYPIGKTAFLGITASGPDPQFCADFANALAEEYMDFKEEERMNTSQATVLSLTQQANRLHEELKRAEERALAFARENSVVAIRERGNVAAQVLSSLAHEAAQYKMQRMLMEAQQPLLAKASEQVVLSALSTSLGLPLGVASIPSGGAGEGGEERPVPGAEKVIEYGVVSQPQWQTLNRENAMLQARVVSYRKKFRDAHPLIQEALAAIEENKQSMDVELQFALNTFYSRLEALSIREQAARRVEQEWEDEALEVSRKLQEYGGIQRNSERLQSLYDLIFNRLKEIDISVGIEPESVQIMERARASSSPITPRKLQSIFLAALIGLGIGLGLVFGLEFLDDSIRYPEEVTHGLGLPFFGLVPAANWDPDDLRTHILSNIDQKSGIAEAYRNVRSALLFGTRQDGAKTIVITSAVPREGKTTTCLNLAVSLAQAGSRVLMVDGDLRRGELHKFFGLEAGKGFSDILVGQAKPEAVIQRTGLQNLDLVATGPFPPNPAEIVLRPELNAFLDYVRREYDRILIDCPPVMSVSEAGILASIVEGVIMVVWAGQTSRKLSQLAVQLLQERGARIMGCVLNNLDFGRVGYYYYSTYYGYYDYGYYRHEPGEESGARKGGRPGSVTR
ncbi:MAG: polysaccharide biosynthesis tyrosine autokinase [Phycisphaerae bacterium]|nr:polysaccharide biosynthesis tyrosine autokinase [Phycisphaerae bacterium]